MVPEMKSLTHIDMSDTTLDQVRADLCMGIRAWSTAASKYEIISLNLANNILGNDGIKSCREFLATTSSLQILNVRKCSLGDESCEMLFDC